MSDFILTEENYYSREANNAYCSASQYFSFIGRPAIKGCPERAMAELRGEWEQEVTDALLIGSIVDCLWEGASPEQLAEKFPECISTRGATAGQLKSQYKKALDLYERTLKDDVFKFLMSGEKQVIMTGEIEGLPFKIKMDSYMPGKFITDLKTTQDVDRTKRHFVPDSGEWLPFYMHLGYDVQLALYREVVRQNTGETLLCHIAAVDKKPHPSLETIQFAPSTLDDALERVKRNCKTIIRYKNGELEPYRCECCDYCRDTKKCEIISDSEFELNDFSKDYA